MQHLPAHASALLPAFQPVLRGAAWLCLSAALVLAGCSSTPVGSGGSSPRPVVSAPAGRDGPPTDVALADVARTPDAEPKVEPIRAGGPNKPYEVLGQTYVPMTADEPLTERGLASWYGRKFHGRRTASGETYNMLAMTAAHKTMPIPSFARVRNPANGREVIVRVNDRGPFSEQRVIDLSYAAAVRLGVQNGVAPVEVQRLTHDEIRAGLGARPMPEPAPAEPETRMAAVSAPAPKVAAAAPAPTARPLPAPVPLPAVSNPTPAPGAPVARAHTTASVGFWLQLGAFGKGDGAYSFQQRVANELDWLAPLMTVFAEGGMHRLQAGPWPTREQAREAADKVRGALQLVPVLIERR
ncbi:septal ring lytic transglycosylase RlpA family protein [Ideonella margarita]|uniref:Endolytic peptidoglycan transglycosylase RlpA n=1 Tax=Ideonella margarita TaxID=2984191 RepID=A0ABU9C5Q6_9BURK